jgi:DNA-binding NarL/FixJ family response regulator
MSRFTQGGHDPRPAVREPPTVVLADDHAATRVGVRAALEQGGFAVVGEAASGQAAVEEVMRHRPDLCLLDLSMPGGGINAAARISEDAPETKIVILTVSPNEDDLLAAVVAGASGYVLKDTSAAKLPQVLGRVLDGEAALPRIFQKRLVEEIRARDSQLRTRRRFVSRRHVGSSDLTEREWEVLELFAASLPTTVVAQRLGISEVTVRRHISSAVHKLGVANRAGAVDVLQRQGGLGEHDS